MTLRKTLFLFLFLCIVHPFVFAQDWTTKHGFCGVALKKWQLKEITPQAKFMHLRENDTIVDIGSSSGWFEGALGTTTKVMNMHFILVDIDSACLNASSIARMTDYYSELKGGPIHYTYEININSEKELNLAGQFGKVLVRNTLHEVSDQQEFAKQVAAITRVGGELFIIEVLPTEDNQVHKGCHKPLLSFKDINSLFENNGFVLREKQDQKLKKKATLQLLRYVKK
jgi:hypothetical protein